MTEWLKYYPFEHRVHLDFLENQWASYPILGHSLEILDEIMDNPTRIKVRNHEKGGTLEDLIDPHFPGYPPLSSLLFDYRVHSDYFNNNGIHTNLRVAFDLARFDTQVVTGEDFDATLVFTLYPSKYEESDPSIRSYYTKVYFFNIESSTSMKPDIKFTNEEPYEKEEVDAIKVALSNHSYELQKITSITSSKGRIKILLSSRNSIIG